MRLKLIVYLGLLAYVFSSCVDAKFKEPQPSQKKELKVFPKAMQGKFVDNDGDTIKIVANQISSIKTKPSTKNKDQFTLGDSVRIKMFKGYAFVSILLDDGYWTAIMVEITKDYLHLYQIESESKRIKDLKRITQVEEFKNEDDKVDFLLLNPSKREWRKIIRAGIPEIVASYRRVE